MPYKYRPLFFEGQGPSAIRSMEHWYALHVRSCAERIVAAALDRIEVENYFPVRPAESGEGRSTSTIVRIDERRRRPLFPGYVFGRFDLERKRPIVSIPQVLRILGSGWLPIAIQDSELESVRVMAAAPVPLAEHPFLEAGQKVRVLYGPLTNVVGIFHHAKGPARIVVSISIMGRSISAEVDAGQLEAIGPCSIAGLGGIRSRLAA